jgi:hypothetical protein
MRFEVTKYPKYGSKDGRKEVKRNKNSKKQE